MAILTCKQICECISLQIFSKYPIKKSRDRTNPPDLPTLKAYPTPGVGGRFGIFSLKWRGRMNLKVPLAILPLGCTILSTRAKTVRGVGTTPLGELGLTAHNWQKWKSIFLTCHWHKICRVEAVGLKRLIKLKTYNFCKYVKFEAISWKKKWYFVNNCPNKVLI